MNIEKIREEFEVWYLNKFCGGQDRLFRCVNADQIYYFTEVQSKWDAWQASRAAIEVELQPEWRPMSDNPPFPFSGDIYAYGKVITNASWCSGYWQSPRHGNIDPESVSHWKAANPEIKPPAK